MGIQEQLPSLGGGEGNGEIPDAASPKPRNSSGSLSPAAQLVTLRLQVIELAHCLAQMAENTGHYEVHEKVKRMLQQGFRTPKGRNGP